MDYRRFFPVFKMIGAALLIVGLFVLVSSQDEPGRAIGLQAPYFVSLAHADSEAVASFLDEEAGISVYTQAEGPINFDHIRIVFRTIEVETADYMIGSVAIPNYPETYDAHVYVHQSGWLLAYYPGADPASKIVDWRTYSGNQIPNKLEIALNRIATQGQFNLDPFGYYDFRYPNATHLMMVARQNGTFQIRLPESFTYYEMGWTLGFYSGPVSTVEYRVDNQTISRFTNYSWNYSYGRLTAEQLIPDLLHNISITASNTNQVYGGLVLIYRE